MTSGSRRRSLRLPHNLSCIAAVALAFALAGERAAEARLIDLHAGARAGGISGWGSTSGTPDFFDTTRGGALGAEVGLKLLVFDLSFNFLQVIDGSGRVGTLSQALLGFEIDVPVGSARTPEGKQKTIFRPGIAGGLGFGTPGPVHPPLDNSQISHKGVVAQLKLALEYTVHPLLGIGVEGDFGYHYFLGGTVLNNSKDYSSGYHLIGLGTITFHLGY
jgi:hypothetical protein